MNKTLYRVIFNRKRGAVVAVAETTKREGKSYADSGSGGVHVPSVSFTPTHSKAFCFSALGFSLCLALGTADIAFADGIIADKAAPKTQQATILQTGNGIPQVNIQTPTSAGVSVNQYAQFDVGNRGAILNNSRSNTQTQLGGWIQGNPWLARGEARVVVNQINSSHPSQLNGYIEVGGRRAEVVIANPAGIAVDGGGFINASRATLTTGQPQYQAGDLSGFKIRQGNVVIAGHGLDARDTDYTRILSYHSKIDAPVWGQDVRVVAGQNDVAATGDAHSPILNNAAANTSNNTANNGTHIPLFAIDTGKLGGMYANKITLISTAEQAGIRNQGQLFASAGNVAIDANGRLVNSGTMAAANVQDMNNTAEHKVNIRSQAFENSGTAVSQQGTQIHSQSIQNTGKLLSAGTADLAVSGSLNNQNGEIITNQQLIIHDGQQSTAVIDNTNGTIQSGHDVAIQAKSLSDNGTLAADNKLDIALQDDFYVGRKIVAGNELSLSTRGSLKNSHTLQAGKRIRIKANNLDNAAQGNIQSGGTTDIGTQHNLTNRGLIDGQQTKIQAGQVNNIGTGRIYGDNIAIAATRLDNQDENGTGAAIAAREKLNLGIGQLNNRENSLIYSGNDMAVGGALDTNGQATGKAQSIRNAGATIEAAGKMRLGVEKLRNTNEHLKTQLVETGREHIVDYEAFGRHELLREGTQHELGWSVYNDESDHLRTPDGAAHENWHKYDYEKVTQKTQVTQTAPAKIISGNDLTIDGKEVFNTDSQIIASGNLLVQTEKDGLHNEQTFGEKKVFSENGKLHSYWREKHKGRDSTGHSEQNYTLPEEITRNISLGSFAYESHRKALSHHAPSQGTELPQSNGISLPYTSNSFTPLPGSSLYIINPANKGYLVETDPRFANYRQWLGSDYMLDSLKLDPNNLHKRLGDGYYEQRLINEQIAELTGHRRLDGYQNDEEQFKALMDNGATAARSMNLSVGIALSAEQVAQLTGDIVWLVQKEVKLPDGGTQTVLVPQVYVRVKNGDIDGKGALLSGSNTQINVSGSLKNSGTIAGRNALIINTDTLDNIGGRIHAQKSAVTATQDINNIGGMLSAEQTLLLNAGNNINSQSTTASSQNTQGSSTYLDRMAGIYITGKEKGVLAAQAGKDINMIAGQISNQSEQGQTRLQAGRDINLDTVQAGKHQATHFDADNHVIRGSTNEVGSSIQTKGDVTLLSGNNLNAKAAEVSSANGTLAVSAKNDINISAGINTTHVDDASKHTGRSGGGNKLIITDKAQSHNETAQSSTFEGKQVVLQAGNDANILGSNVISDNGTRIQAGNHVRIGTTQTQSQSETYHQTQKSGLMSAGIGFTIGSKTNTQENQSQSNEHTGSTVGSLKGDTTIVAGKHYEQIGSTVSSPEGNNTIHAQSIDIQAAHNKLNSNTTQTYEQKGLTVAFSSPVTDLAQQAIAVAQSSKQVGQSKNDRVNAMAAANAGWQAYQTGKSAQNLAKGTTNAKQVSISITYGEQQNRQTTQVQASQAQASQIQAGGKTTLIATGAAEQSNINIAGSDVAGKAGTILIADNDITLQSAEQSNTERSQNKSAGWNAGAAVSFGQGGWSLGVTAGGNVGKGYGNGDSITHRHSHIGDKGGQTLIQSGGDTTIKGAQVRGKGVQVNAKNLSIQSVQDRETYQSKQQNAGAQVTVGYGFSAGGDYSQSKIRADHASVTEQSGIYAGEDGYQIKVGNHTDLKGGIITSTQSAEDKGKNRFQTATLTHSDIQNHSQYKGESFGLGASASISGKTLGQGAQNKPQNKHLTSVADKNGASSSVGYGSDSDSQSSITKSGINTRNIHITDEAGQLARTGRTAKETEARIYTGIDTETADQHTGRLKNSFDKDAVAKEINLQREVTKEFGRNAAQAVAAVADKLGNTQSYERYQEARTLLEAELQNTDSEAEKAAIRASLGQVNAYLAENQSRYDIWKEGGIGRSILHGAAGGLTTGSLGGILAGSGTSLAAPYLDKAAENLGSAGKAAVNALGGAAIGYAAGGNVGTAAVGANVDWNNRQLHDSEIRKIKDNAAKFAKLHPGISQRQAEERLVAQAMRQVDAAYYAKHADTDTAAEQFLRSIAGSFKADGETFLDFAPMKYYRDSGKFAEQQGYRETREQLKRNAVSSYTERSRQIRNKTFDTATAGIGKGIANLPSSYINGFIGLYNGTIGKPVGKEAPYVPLIMEYDNPIEEEVGAWAADKFDRAAGILTGIKAGAVSSGRGAWNKNGKTGAGQKAGGMSVLDGEMGFTQQNKAGGAGRANLYSQNWQEADLNAAIRKFVGTNPSVSFTPKGKAIYQGQNGIQIIHDIEGNYFRILDTKISGKRPYLDLNGNIPNNKINANGNQQGRTQAEYNGVTHFKIRSH
ncbi:hemagglutinin repeat-containing protein [Neisseria lactamica]|uniref:two-partner secretion domain-containing protein n=1 Tax=Neisseria lactamica TaxID=486 RepID=UPI001EFE1FBC|nr:hemagglutinin repeat-containing protein [Neisseria lactamica]